MNSDDEQKKQRLKCAEQLHKIANDIGTGKIAGVFLVADGSGHTIRLDFKTNIFLLGLAMMSIVDLANALNFSYKAAASPLKAN